MRVSSWHRKGMVSRWEKWRRAATQGHKWWAFIMSVEFTDDWRQIIIGNHYSATRDVKYIWLKPVQRIKIMTLVPRNEFQHNRASSTSFFLSFFLTQKSKSDKPVRLSRDDIIIERLVQIALRRQTSVFPPKSEGSFPSGLQVRCIP